MQKLGLRRQLTYQSALAEKRNTNYGRNTKYGRPYVSAVKTDVNEARQTLGASVDGLRFLFSHAGFCKALAKDVGSDCNLVGDPNLPLLGCGRCWCGFLLFGGIPTLYWGR